MCLAEVGMGGTRAGASNRAGERSRSGGGGGGELRDWCGDRAWDELAAWGGGELGDELASRGGGAGSGEDDGVDGVDAAGCAGCSWEVSWLYLGCFAGVVEKDGSVVDGGRWW